MAQPRAILWAFALQERHLFTIVWHYSKDIEVKHKRTTWDSKYTHQLPSHFILLFWERSLWNNQDSEVLLTPCALLSEPPDEQQWCAVPLEQRKCRKIQLANSKEQEGGRRRERSLIWTFDPHKPNIQWRNGSQCLWRVFFCGHVCWGLDEKAQTQKNETDY